MNFGGPASPMGMSNKQTREIFINLAVRDLETSKAFFSALGFTFNAKFTDDKAACMVINDHAYVMLLREPFFQTFTKKTPADPAKGNEALIAVSAESRTAVDTLVNQALESGGTPAMPPQDHGFMYGRSFYDPDGHHWEVLWMDPKVAAS